MDVAVALRDARRAAGLSEAALAARAGTSQATISAYEHGRKAPSVDTLERLLSVAGSRLTVVSTRPQARMPSRAEHARTARGLLDVIALGEALPVRHERE